MGSIDNVVDFVASGGGDETERKSVHFKSGFPFPKPHKDPSYLDSITESVLNSTERAAYSGQNAVDLLGDDDEEEVVDEESGVEETTITTIDDSEVKPPTERSFSLFEAKPSTSREEDFMELSNDYYGEEDDEDEESSFHYDEKAGVLSFSPTAAPPAKRKRPFNDVEETVFNKVREKLVDVFPLTDYPSREVKMTVMEYLATALWGEVLRPITKERVDFVASNHIGSVLSEPMRILIPEGSPHPFEQGIVVEGNTRTVILLELRERNAIGQKLKMSNLSLILTEIDRELFAKAIEKATYLSASAERKDGSGFEVNVDLLPVTMRIHTIEEEARKKPIIYDPEDEMRVLKAITTLATQVQGCSLTTIPLKQSLGTVSYLSLSGRISKHKKTYGYLLFTPEDFHPAIASLVERNLRVFGRKHCCEGIIRLAKTNVQSAIEVCEQFTEEMDCYTLKEIIDAALLRETKEATLKNMTGQEARLVERREAQRSLTGLRYPVLTFRKDGPLPVLLKSSMVIIFEKDLTRKGCNVGMVMREAFGYVVLAANGRNLLDIQKNVKHCCFLGTLRLLGKKDPVAMVIGSYRHKDIFKSERLTLDEVVPTGVCINTAKFV